MKKQWKAGEKVLKKRCRACEVCGSTTHLQVHHAKYRWPRLAWEYDITDMRVLCRRCHAETHGKPVDYVSELFGI